MKRDRRSLSHVGGRVTVRGDRDAGRLLSSALDVASALEDEDEAQAHVHGFHVYPARMHPLTARRLVEALSRPRGAVLDPFCGSGTVLVEARLAGRFAAGVDANPLAVRLARLKATTTTAAQRELLVTWAAKISQTADVRREARAGASRRYPDADVALFDPHVLLELDGLRVGLEGFSPRSPEEVWAREALWIVLSAILTKVSRRASDTADAKAPRRAGPRCKGCQSAHGDRSDLGAVGLLSKVRGWASDSKTAVSLGNRLVGMRYAHQVDAAQAGRSAGE